MDKAEPAQIIAQAAADLKAGKVSDSPADRIATAKLKVVMDATSTTPANETTDATRASLSSDELTSVVAYQEARRVATQPVRHSPGFTSQADMSQLLGDELRKREEGIR